MDNAVYVKLKGIVIQDLLKDPHRAQFHERELKTEDLTPEYRRAVEEALAELRAAQRSRGAAAAAAQTQRK
ncbi:hypothetical protein ASF11_20195 [Acidovorax sp. Leaf76]|uniref:hypothetical protein n=1 Tax=unclassified Acidovorax TaxID=2684926 RepID=UPI0006F73594|nr:MULTISPECIES: hypothetical protein [unclassified Acidovorax]KQO24658.1 hypothetical protein ASF11_20195 [Acidovorax sp. Leaf76]KQO39663.1 hypothetical protein ASF19_18130 [Acidovorax sp. Leaf84]